MYEPPLTHTSVISPTYDFFFFLVSSWCFICGRIDTYSVIPKRKKATTAWLTKYLLNDVIVLSLVLVTELRSEEDTDKSFKTHRACWQCAENPPSTCQIHCIFQIILHGCTPPLTSNIIPDVIYITKLTE